MPKKAANLLPLRAAKRRTTWEQRTQQKSRGASILFRAFSDDAPKLVETATGDLVRDWGPSDWRHMTNAEVRTALRGKAAFDHDELLGWIPPQTIKDAVSRRWLWQGDTKGLYFVTRKAAIELDLPRSLAGRKIRFLDRGL